MDRNSSSFTDSPGLSSSWDIWKNVLSDWFILCGCLNTASYCTCLSRFSLTMILFGQGVDKVVLPSDITAILFATATSDLLVLSRQPSSTITHPRWGFWAFEALGGPMRCSSTWCASPRSRRLKKMMLIFESSGIRWSAMSCRWRYLSAISGVGISHLLSRISSHSMNVGRLNWQLPSRASTANALTPLPLQVDCPLHENSV